MKIEVFSLLLILGIAALLFADRKNIERRGLVFIRRTRRFLGFINSVSRHGKFWKIAGTVSVAVCVLVMVFTTATVFQTSFKILKGEVRTSQAFLLLPSAEKEVRTQGPLLLIPVWLWLLAIAVVVVPHEFFHGIFARVERVRIKSVGLMVAAVIPGAFVELSEKSLERKPVPSRLRIYSAGSFANFVTAVVLFLLTWLVVWPVLTGPGVVLAAREGSELWEAGFRSGVVTEVNGVPVSSDYREMATGNFLSQELGTPETVTFEFEGKKFSARFEDVKTRPVTRVDPGLFFSLVNALTFLWIISVAVGAINLLPIYPLDGGQIFRAAASGIFGRSEGLTRFVSIITLGALLTLFLPSVFSG